MMIPGRYWPRPGPGSSPRSCACATWPTTTASVRRRCALFRNMRAKRAASTKNPLILCTTRASTGSGSSDDQERLLVPFILHRVTQQNRSAELELLLLCARLRLDEQHVRCIRELLDRNLAWNEVVFLAGRHGLTPFLHRALSGLNSDRVPVDVQNRLRSMAQAIRFQNLGAVRELIRILQAFEAAGIAATPYKGPALAAFLCNDFGMRESCDVDILVRPSDAIRARSTILWLSPECILLLLCLHGSAHKWEMLKWVLDIAEMLRACPDLDWGKVTNEARRTGSERMVAVGLVLARDLLGAVIPQRALDTIR